jgi:hypothetical protein
VPLPDLTLPYGLRDVKLKKYTGDTLGTAVDLPAGRTLSFSEAEDFEELRGDDKLIAVRGKGPTIGWDLEAGGISLAAYAIIAGGSVVSSGTTPNQVKTYSKLGADVRPYFQAEGQAISDIGGDFHAVLYKLRANGDIEGELADGAFWLTAASGIGLPDADDALYDFVQNEAETAIV